MKSDWLFLFVGVVCIVCSFVDSIVDSIVLPMFTKVRNYITDIHHPRYTGGVEYKFTPFHYLFLFLEGNSQDENT
jgi:hypothetical protein